LLLTKSRRGLPSATFFSPVPGRPEGLPASTEKI
jgi:hypothetical protein